MNHITVIFLSVFTTLNFSSCVRGVENKTEENINSELTKYLMDSIVDINKNIVKDTIDYSSIKFSEDSIDIALFNLLVDQNKYSKTKLLNNIEILIKKGANPNAIIDYTYSYRKLGTYIPIIKSFYKNKYRTVKDNSTTVHVAVNSKKIYLVEKLIELGASINLSDNNNIFPIDVALKNKDSLMVNVLLANKCKVENAKLSVCSDIELLEKMVKLGADAKTIDINFALSDEQTLKRLFNLGVDVNKSQLDYRKIFYNENILDLLLEHGLNNSARGKFPNNKEPLIYGAIEYGNLNTIKKLKDAGIDIWHKKKSANIFISPFIDVIKSQKIDIINYYIENDANVNETDWTKRSVLMYAVESENDAVIKILIDAGANKEYTGYFNKTPLMHAVQMDKYISAQTLIDLGANINFKNGYGESCLMNAIKNKNFPMIKLLIEKGVNIKQKYKKMNMPEYAKSVDAQDIIISYLEQQMNN